MPKNKGTRNLKLELLKSLFHIILKHTIQELFYLISVVFVIFTSYLYILFYYSKTYRNYFIYFHFLNIYFKLYTTPPRHWKLLYFFRKKKIYAKFRLKEAENNNSEFNNSRRNKNGVMETYLKSCSNVTLIY